MAVQDYKINYKSDFVLTINGDAGWATQFCIKFWTGMPSQAYFVGFDGVKYVNCRVGDTTTQLLVMFDDHHLPIGKLEMQIAYHTTIEEFPGSVFDEVTNARDVIVTIDGTDYQVMLDFTGEDAPELEFNLPAYANEAERIQNELQRQQNEADRIAAELQREQATAAAVQGAEKVNAQLNGTTLTVTNRQGVSTSVNTKGEQGEQGPVGPEGPQGEQGPQGEKGDTGATGPQGSTGPQGPKGDTGVSINDFVETGETETDTLYDIEFSDGTTKPVAIPKGEKGDQGEQGPEGPQGPMGDVAVITPEQQAAFTMYSTTGQNTNGPMTQKAVTDAIGNIAASGVSYDNSQSGLAAENVQGALDELNENDKAWENDIVLDGARYIHTDYSYAIDNTQPTWRVTNHISLEDKKGQIIHFPKVYKSSQDMFTYVLYTAATSSNYITGSGYKVTSQSESLTWGEIAVDDILEQYPTAKYIKFTLNTNFYHQPYTTIPIKNIEEQIKEIQDGIEEDSLIFKNETYIDQRYIHTDGSFPADRVTHAWKITDAINLRELVGSTLYFFRVYKSTQDMLTYAFYSGQAAATWIDGAYVSDAITQQADNYTWDSFDVDDILRQYPTANYVRFTLHGSYLTNQPYAVSSLKNVVGLVKSNTKKQSLNDTFNMGWTDSKRIDANGGVSDCSASYTVSGLIPLSQLSAYLLVGYECYSSAYDTRTWALYNSSNVCVAVSEPTDSHSYSRPIIIDTQELLEKYPSATQIRFGCHVNYLFELVEKGSVIARTYKNEINAERPSKGGLDNFTFAAAGSSGVINIVSNTDADVTQYETLGVNFAQVLKIGNYYVCFYYASSASGEYNQAIFCAYSSNGTTWTRGFPPNVTPPVAGTNKLFDNTASGYRPITESCWCRVPDKDYPYRMIANRNMSGTNKSCWMWKSADGYNYELMGQILGDAYRPDTQYSAVVRGNVIKLYLRISETIGSGSSSQYKRSIAVAYLDIDGNMLTPPYKLIYDYRYTSAACVLDNMRELLIPTWFANNINSAPKTENAYLETFIVEGDKYEKIDTNINDCLNDDTLWVAVAPDFVTINNEQYICVNERNTDHASAMDKSSIKLVKVTRT